MILVYLAYTELSALAREAPRVQSFVASAATRLRQQAPAPAVAQAAHRRRLSQRTEVGAGQT